MIAHTAAHCPPAGAKIVAAGSRVSVYSAGSSVFACSRVNGRVTRLGGVTAEIGKPVARPAVVAGDFAAYGLQRSYGDGVSGTLVVLNARSGRVVVDVSATGTGLPESFQAVSQIVLRPDGAVAWTASDHSIIRRDSVQELDSVDARGHRRKLDGSSALDLFSLRLSGTRLTWRSGGRSHSSTLR